MLRKSRRSRYLSVCKAPKLVYVTMIYGEKFNRPIMVHNVTVG